MNSFHQPDFPVSAKVLSLVRLHHGLPSRGGEEIPVVKNALKRRPTRLWKSGARLNHLSARRRRLAIEKISSDCFPAILELSHGSNFVILKEKVENSAEEGDAYIVQFPDSREALVRGARLRELYDGTCVLLSPGKTRADGFFDRLRAFISKRRNA